MKKQYIQPESHVVIVNLMGSILQETEYSPIGPSRAGAIELDSRQAYDNRFEDDDEDWDWE